MNLHQNSPKNPDSNLGFICAHFSAKGIMYQKRKEIQNNILNNNPKFNIYKKFAVEWIDQIRIHGNRIYNISLTLYDIISIKIENDVHLISNKFNMHLKSWGPTCSYYNKFGWKNEEKTYFYVYHILDFIISNNFTILWSHYFDNVGIKVGISEKYNISYRYYKFFMILL